MTDNWDAIVVGGGIGGVATAACLAHAGKRTLVLEARGTIGGRATSIPVKGILSELGFHGLAAGGHIEKLLPALGKYIPMVKLEPNFVIYDDKRFFEVPGTPNEFADFDYIPAAHRAELVDVLSVIRDISFDEAEDYDFVSWGDWIKSKTSCTEIREFLLLFGNVPLTEEFPSNIAAGEALRCLSVALREGGWSVYPERGAYRAISDAFAEVVNEQGLVRCNVRVREILVKDDAVTAVIAEAPEGLLKLSAPIVVSNLPVWDIVTLVSPDRFPRWFIDRIRLLEEHSQLAPRSSVGLTCVASMPLHSYRTSVLVPSTSDANMTGPAYVRWLAEPTNWAPQLAPDGQHLFQYGPVWPRWYVDLLRERPALMEKELRGFYNELWKIFPEFRRDSIVWQGKGTLLATDLSQKFPGNAWKHRLDVKAPQVDGLYFVGDTVRGWGVASDSAVSSAVLCAENILGTKVVGALSVES